MAVSSVVEQGRLEVAYLATVRVRTQFVNTRIQLGRVAKGVAAAELVGVGTPDAPEWSDGSGWRSADGRRGRTTGRARAKSGGAVPFALSMTGAHWRSRGSEVAITVIRRDDTQVVMYDHATGITRFLAQYPRPFDPSPCHCPQGLVARDPRWSPAGTTELLFVLLDEKTGVRRPTS